MLNKMRKHFGKNAYYEAPSKKGMDFFVIHYAGKVRSKALIPFFWSYSYTTS